APLLAHRTPCKPVDRCPPDAEQLRDRGRPQPFIQESSDLVRVNRPWAALVNALRFGRLDALHLSLAPEVRFELGEDAQHVQERLAGRRAGVDGLLCRLQVHTALAQLMDEVLEVPEGPR